MSKCYFFIILLFCGNTFCAQIDKQKIEKLITELAPKSHQDSMLSYLKSHHGPYHDYHISSLKNFFKDPKGRQHPELFPYVINFNKDESNILNELLKYADDQSFPLLVEKIRKLYRFNIPLWSMLLKNPKTKNKISLFRGTHGPTGDSISDLEDFKNHQVIIDLAHEEDFDHYFTLLSQYYDEVSSPRRPPNIKAMRKVLSTPPYNRNSEMLGMAMRLPSESYQDFVNHFDQIHSGKSWRKVLEEKLVAALGQEFVEKNIKLPDYVISLDQIAAVERLITEGSLNPQSIHGAIELGKNPSSYQTFLTIIKKTGPGKIRDYYLNMPFTLNLLRGPRHFSDIEKDILKTDHLFEHINMVQRLMNEVENKALRGVDPPNYSRLIPEIEDLLKILKEEKINQYDIQKIMDRVGNLIQSVEIESQLNFAKNVIQKKKGVITASLILDALIIPTDPSTNLYRKAFLLGVENLSDDKDIERLGKYLTKWSPNTLVSNEGLASFLQILKEVQANDLNFYDILTGKYIHREQARKLIHKYAHPEDIKWALEYLEKSSEIRSPQGLEILKEILTTTSTQREKRLIELAISEVHRNTPLSLFKKAIEILSKDDLELFMKIHMANNNFRHENVRKRVTFILNDPFTATWEPFLKIAADYYNYFDVIKKEQEVIQLARKKLPTQELKVLENKLKENFSTNRNKESEVNRLDSIQTLLHHSPDHNPNPMLQDLLDQGPLSNLQLKSFKEMLELSHPDDSLKLLQIIRRNEMTDLKSRVFFALLLRKKPERNLSLINALLSLDLRDDKKTIEAIFLIADKAPPEMAADLVSHLNGVVLNEEQLAAIKNGLKTWPPADLKQFFLHTLDRKHPAPSTKLLVQEVSASTIRSHNEIKEFLKSWSLNETQLKAKIEEAVILARTEVDFRRWLLDQVLDRDPAKKWRFSKTNDLLRQRSAAILIRTYEGTDEVSPLMKELEKVAENRLGQTYRHKPHFRFEEENPLIRQALQHFAGGDLAPTSSCDQIKQIIADARIELGGF